MVEFALVLPLLVMFIFGMVEFGRGYNAKIELTSAVREGARSAALAKDVSTISATTRSAAAGLTATNITVSVYSDTSGVLILVPASPGTALACTAGVTNGVVKVSYPYTYDIPLVGRRTSTISARGVMRCGG